MGHPEVEIWRVDAPTRPCAFCRQNVEGEKCKSCPRCAAVYHPDCWVSNSRRCAVYGCEPGRKPAAVLARPIRPMLQPPPLPRSGVNFGWLVPLLIVLAVNVARIGMSGSSSRPSPPPPAPQILREFRHADLEALMEPPEPVVPASAGDVPALLEEAQALEGSSSALMSVPGGPLTPDVRRMLRDTVVADLISLQRALRLYRSCAAARLDPDHREHVERLRTLIGRKRSVLLDLMRPRVPD